MIRLAPGGPFDLERPIDPLIMENLRAAYNLDAPALAANTSTYLGNLLRGDLGPSFTSTATSRSNDLFADRPAGLDPAGLARAAARGRCSAPSSAPSRRCARTPRRLSPCRRDRRPSASPSPTSSWRRCLSLFFGVMARLAAGRRLERLEPVSTWVLPVV
jgi:oligopeptide transport system permease protein